jgi:hypothetical protein
MMPGFLHPPRPGRGYSMIRKVLLTFSGLLLAAVTAGPAYARPAPTISPHPANGPRVASQEICAQSGSGYCLNDWNGAGSGGAVKMYNSGVTNDNWQWIQLTGYCNRGYVDPSCPFPVGSGLDTTLNENPIFEMKSSVSGACIGTDIYSNANLGACPPIGGTGVGSNIWVQHYIGPSSYDYINVYWSGQRGNSGPAYLESGGAIGAQAFVTAYGGSVWGTP